MAGRNDSQQQRASAVKNQIKALAIASCIAGFFTSAPLFAETPVQAPHAEAKDIEQLAQATEKKADEKNVLEVAPFVAEYDVETNALPISGSGVRSLKSLGDGRYRLEQVAKSFLLTRREISEFKMDHCDIKPTSYRYEQSGIGRDKRHLIDFNADGKTAIFEENKHKSVIELPENQHYDRLSETMVLQCKLLERRLNGEGNTPDSPPLSIDIIDKESLRTHDFVVIGEETIKVNDTEMKTLRVERQRDNEDRQTIMWFAPGQTFTLVKLEQINKGKSVTLELNSIKQVF
ncbi:MAG: hypothetical protein CMD81_12860 [Gammaproteobacteria bacterium]|nr:hypothetical protein [Gammaproteobacteria bacterium]HBF06726.1 hypothetical protein [Gammaproteobacteria bacterium]|tara:strand:- start:55332 stop:56201 length:870 start_codon:yes stop_codon:yes gene_type:complete